jgi:hypothetical protein
MSGGLPKWLQVLAPPISGSMDGECNRAPGFVNDDLHSHNSPAGRETIECMSLQEREDVRSTIGGGRNTGKGGA